jgi:hypothetical protein
LSILKRILLVTGLLASLIGPATTIFAAPAGTAVVSVSPASQTVPLGGNFSVTVTVDAGSPTLGFQFGVDFDPTKVAVDTITRGNFLDNYVTTIGNGAFVFAQPWTIDNTGGHIAVGGAAIINGGTNPGPTGTGNLATINLHALNANGSTSLTLTGATVNGNTTVTINNGSVVTGSVPLPLLQIMNAATVAQTDPTKFNVTFAVKNAGTQDYPGGDAATVTVTGAAPATATVNLPAIAAGATSASLSAGPFTLSGTLSNVTISSTNGRGGTATATTAYQHSALSSNGQTPIDAQLAATLTLTPPGAETTTLTAGIHNKFGGASPKDVLNIKANVDWQTTLSGENGGKLTEFDGTAYTTGGAQLTNALVTSGGDAPTLTVSGSPQTFVANTRANSDPANGNDYTVAYDQLVGFNDAPVNAPHSYHIVLTWTANGTF